MAVKYKGHLLPEEATRLGDIKLPGIYKQIKKNRYAVVRYNDQGKLVTLIVGNDYLAFRAKEIKEIEQLLEAKKKAFKELRGALSK